MSPVVLFVFCAVLWQIWTVLIWYDSSIITPKSFLSQKLRVAWELTLLNLVIFLYCVWLCPVSSQTVLSVTLSVSPSFPLQIRRALLQILFPDKPFRWAIHIGIAFCLLFLVNLLVILVPSIRDIFGLIGTSTRDRWHDSRCINDIICARCNHLLLHPSGATSAPSLIFILPGIFYIRIVPEEQEPLMSRTKITVQL